MTTTTISDFRANIKQYVESVLTSHEPVIINRGSTGAVLISLDEYNSIRATERVLANPSVLESIKSSDAEEESIEVNIDEL